MLSCMPSPAYGRYALGLTLSGVFKYPILVLFELALRQGDFFFCFVQRWCRTLKVFLYVIHAVHFLPLINISQFVCRIVSGYAIPSTDTVWVLSSLAAIYTPFLLLSCPFFASAILTKLGSGLPGHTMHLSIFAMSNCSVFTSIIVGYRFNTSQFWGWNLTPLTETFHEKLFLTVMQIETAKEDRWLVSLQIPIWVASFWITHLLLGNFNLFISATKSSDNESSSLSWVLSFSVLKPSAAEERLLWTHVLSVDVFSADELSVDVFSADELSVDVFSVSVDMFSADELSVVVFSVDVQSVDVFSANVQSVDVVSVDIPLVDTI